MDNADARQPTVTLAVGAGGSGYSYLNLPWDKWVAIASFIYVLIQIFKTLPELPERWRRIKAWFNRSKRE